jgi:NADPH-dependent 7-cyano-7-deazaguanine reductase QueF
MNTHKAIVHGKCPINGSWDYYNVTIKTNQFVETEYVDGVMNAVRGQEITQETMASQIFDKLRWASKLENFKMSLVGRHGQNNELAVELVSGGENWKS